MLNIDIYEGTKKNTEERSYSSKILDLLNKEIQDLNIRLERATKKPNVDVIEVKNLLNKIELKKATRDIVEAYFNDEKDTPEETPELHIPYMRNGKLR